MTSMKRNRAVKDSKQKSPGPTKARRAGAKTRAASARRATLRSCFFYPIVLVDFTRLSAGEVGLSYQCAVTQLFSGN